MIINKYKIEKIECIVTYVNGLTYGRRYKVVEQDIKGGVVYIKIINNFFKEITIKESWGYYDDVTRDEKLEKLLEK